MNSKTVIVSAVLLFAMLVSGCNGSAGSATVASAITPIRSMTVSGDGKVSLKPDIAYINIGVHTDKPTASEAVAQNNTDTQAVLDALKAAGVAVEDMQTTNFSIYQNNQQSPDGTVTTTGYFVDNTVYVTVRDLTKLGSLLDAVVKAGANNINSIQFDVADKTKALTDARAAAVQAAKAQAEELATATGVTLGSIQTVAYSANTPGPIFYGKGGGGGLAVADAAVPISPGQLEISATVTLTYEIK